MRQLVEADQRNLRTLPVVNRGFELQVRELDLAAARPAPLAHSHMRGAAELRIEIQALIPERSGLVIWGMVRRKKTAVKLGTRLTWRSGSDQAGRVLPPPAAPP